LGGSSESAAIELFATLFAVRPEGEPEATTLMAFFLALASFFFFFFSCFLYLSANSRAAASSAGIAPIAYCKLMSTIMRVCIYADYLTYDILDILD